MKLKKEVKVPAGTAVKIKLKVKTKPMQKPKEMTRG